MSYEELSKQIVEQGYLTQLEVNYFTMVLKNETKVLLAQYAVRDAAEMLSSAADAVNRGSMERVDTLVRKAMDEIGR